MSLGLRHLAILGTMLALQLAGANAAPAVDGLSRMRRDLCHSFKLDCRKQHASPSAKARAAPAKPSRPRQAPTKAAEPAAMVPTPVPKPQPAPAPSTPGEAMTAPVPIPRVKPAAAPSRKAAAEAPPSSAVALQRPVPIPRERPALLPSLPPVASVVVAAPEVPPDGGKAEPKKPEARTASIAPPASASAGPSTCEQSLRSGKVQFEAVPSSFGDATCPVVDPVRLHAVETPSGVVNFPEGPVFSCRFAQKFASWVSDTGSAVVLAQMNKRLEKVATGPGYDCRHRNGDSSAKMSEHAAGDAVDITSMTVDGGTTIRMADAINPKAPSYAVLRALRTTACGYFTTVLGPGANEAHREHYHFDLGVHGKSANYRICE